MSGHSAARAPRPILPVGGSAVLVECADSDEASALAVWTAAQYGEALSDIVPAMRTVLLVASDATRLSAIATAVAGARPGNAARDDLPAVRIDVVYDGDDLVECASALGIGVDTLARMHQAANWRVAFIGFAPGFAYLIAEDWPLRLPRRADPRPRVPPGAVALADGFSGVYPTASPGGWQLIGRTDARLWDVDAVPPTPFAPGVRVHFTGARG
jgi:KipI family sensor histidine kinase inhibitor